MQISTAIAIAAAPAVAAVARLGLKRVVGYLQRRIRGAKLRRILFTRLWG